MTRVVRTTSYESDAPVAALRSPETVMRLSRLGSFHQTRLSFLRVLLRRLATENWTFARTAWGVDAQGNGHAVYEMLGNGRVYSLVAFANNLDPAKRTDRVIANEWDATFTLHDGRISSADIERLSRNVPKQEAGRYTAAEIVLARANKSVRLFEQVTMALAAGRQPLQADLDDVGYLMRTTAVYGSGKFGLADYEAISSRPEFSGPFGAEMMTVFMIRAYTIDLVEHMARCLSPHLAVPLNRSLARRLGVGNSTGLGMAPFLVTHPSLIDRWITARETALARVRSVQRASAQEVEIFMDMLSRGQQQIGAWSVTDEVQMARIDQLRRDLGALSDHIRTTDLAAEFAWDALFKFADRELGLEAQEFLVTLLIEPYGHLVDDLAEMMSVNETERFRIDGSQTLGELSASIDASYGFALDTDFTAAEATARFWYVSEEKLEPRLGERALDDGAGLEQPLAIARDVKELRQALDAFPPETRLASFLLAHPEHRHAIRRVQLVADLPYAEIKDNLIDVTMRPVDLLRCKLSFFGASDFDPRSDRWVRIALFRHAPMPDEMHLLDANGRALPASTSSVPREKTDHAAPTVALQAIERPTSEDLLSLNELDALVRKAARGAGLSWGLAEETGKVARAMAQSAQPDFERLADTLEAGRAGQLSREVEADGTTWRAVGNLPLDPLVIGPSFLDHAFFLKSSSVIIEGTVSAPSLLLPFLMHAACVSATSLTIASNGGTSSILDGSALSVPQAFGLSVRGADHLGKVPEPTLRIVPITIPRELRRRFEALAALTYVPSSQRSRVSGAGAGLNDND